MLRTLKEIYWLLTADQRKKLLGLQILVALMAFAEIAGVVSIGPFMALVGDMNQLQEEGLFAQVYHASGANSRDQFLFWLGISVLVLLTSAALVSTYTIYQLSMYGERVGAELSNRLFHYYMRQSWLFHASGSSSHLTKQIAVECSRVTGGIVNPLVLMNAKLVMAGFEALRDDLYAIKVSPLERAICPENSLNGECLRPSESIHFVDVSFTYPGKEEPAIRGQVLIDGQQLTFSNLRAWQKSLGFVPQAIFIV